MHEDGDARGDELGTRRRDDDLALRALVIAQDLLPVEHVAAAQVLARGTDAAEEVEADIVERARKEPVFRLHLRDGGGVLRAPDARALGAVRETALVEVEEGLLRDARDGLVDGAVYERPVATRADAAPRRLHVGLRLLRLLQAETDELLAAHVGEVLPHGALGVALGGQAVVGEADRIEGMDSA